VPRADDVVEVQPLLPADAWDWFCLDGVAYHGTNLTIVWDRRGKKYNRGTGFALWVNGQEAGRTPKLDPLTVRLPRSKTGDGF
jgi:hypothetical protein